MATQFNVTGTSTTITGLNQGTKYFYTITPMNQTAAGPTSAVQSATTASGQTNNLILIGNQLLKVGNQLMLDGVNVNYNTNTESTNGTSITSTGATIYDSSLEAFTLVTSTSSGLQVSQNGTVDTTTSNVTLLLYWTHTVYYKNSSNQWFSKTQISNSWASASGDPRIISGTVAAKSKKSAANVSGSVGSATTESPNYTQVTTVGPKIFDATLEAFTLTTGGQVAVNGTADTTTSSVIRLAYWNHLVYQENNAFNWWNKSIASGTWVAQTTDTKTVGVGILDKSGEVFTITSGGLIAVNGQNDTTTASVAELLYFNSLIYHANTSGNWYSKTISTDTWSGPTSDPRTSTGTGGVGSSLAFADSIGVNWCAGCNNNSLAGLNATFQDFGIRHVRCVSSGSGQNLTIMQSLNSNFGVKFLWETDWNVTPADFVSAAVTFTNSNPGAIEYFEGLNEPDNGGANNGQSGQAGVNNAADYQNRLKQAMQGTSVQNIPLTTPPICCDDNGAQKILSASPSFAGNYSVISFHPYPGPHQPEYGDGNTGVNGSLDRNINLQVTPLQNSGRTLEMLATETGYPSSQDGHDQKTHSGYFDNNGHEYDLSQGLDWNSEAIFMPRMYLFNFNKGVKITYKYQLYASDQPQLSGGGSDGTHSLYGYCLQEGNVSSGVKPSYNTVKNLMQLVDDKGSSYTPNALNYSISNINLANTNVYKIALGRRDGSYILALWLYQTQASTASNGILWSNDGGGSPLEMSGSQNQNVTVNIPSGQGLGHYQTSTLSMNGTMNTFNTATTISGNQFTVSVGDAVLLIKLTT